ncbi:MAG: leucine-rich repeat domain-containing protein [Prevotella sp.]|nr:leucine-rich repeat domain-containing protein [Prevotella sp.]
MNKIKLLMLLILAATGMTVSAADAGYEFVESDGGKTLTIKGYGDLTTCSQTSTKKVFAAAANGNIFTNNSGASVNAQADYNPSATYYYAEGGYTPVFDGGAPTNNGQSAYNVATTTAWDETSISANDTYIYPAYLAWDNKVVINGSRITSGSRDNYQTFTYNNNTYTQYVKLNRSANYNEQMEPDESFLLTEAQLATYLTSTTIYTAGYNPILYRSRDGGATIEKLTSGQVYTYKAGDLFYVANSTPTYVQITNNAAFFEAHPAYLEDAEVTTTFKEALLAQLSSPSRSYTKVVFENTGTKGEMLIDPQIVQIINFPNNSQNTNLTSLDLEQATLKLTGDEKFSDILENPGADYSFSNTLAEITLPLVAADEDGNITLPSNAIPVGYTNTAAALKTVNVPVGYTKIGDKAFYQQSVITTVNLPEGLKEIGDEAFSTCSALKNINITDAQVEGRSIVFPSTVETIGKSAFYACNALTSTKDDPFILPSGLKKVKASAFVNLTNLQFLELNEGLEYVGNSAFGLASELHAQTSITFPSTIKYLGPGSFISRWYQDIYFTGKEAPVCPVGTPYGVASDWGNVTAFSANTQMGNNGFNPYLTEGSTADNAHQEGYANRENYVNNGYYFSILHFPAGLTDAQAKTYRDITRRYVTGNFTEDGEFQFAGYGANIAEAIDPATGKTFGSAFKEGTTGERSNLVYYMSDNGLLTESSNADNVQPGYIDTYLGAQQIWPSQAQWTRNFVTVANGVEWDGVTTYRPTLTEEMFEWMKEDELYVKANSLDYSEIREADDNYDDASQRKGEVLSLADKTWEQLTDREKDYLSLILYQGTRRFVLGNDSPYDIPFKMEMEAGRWWSICLPFNMTKKQIDEVFGEGTHVCLFSGVKRTIDGDDKLLRLEFINDVYHHKTERTVEKLGDGSALKYTYGANYSTSNPEPADDDIVIYARESYMIYPTEKSGDAAGVAMRNFGTPDFTIGDPLPTMIQANSKTPYTIDGEYVAYRFIGNFNTTASYDKDGNSVPVKIPRYSYGYGTMGGETKFFILNTDKATWNPFKGIVQNLARNGGEEDWNNFFQKSSTGAKQVSIFGFDDSMTGIEDVIIEASSDNGADKAVYSISGSHVGDSLQGLAPGVYVKQGKAYIVK